MNDTHYRQTNYGFEYGAAKVSRVCSDYKKGWVVLEISTPRALVQVYVTRTGMIKTYKVSGIVKHQEVSDE